LTAPGLGRECGASLNSLRSLFQGVFIAPHVTAQALKTAVFCAAVMESLGYKTQPRSGDERYDITQTITFGSELILRRFCEGIQAASPVDSYVRPEPWDMPGYDCPVIMAAGTFIQGSSIELSCDAPMREPYAAYLQGGITYESGKIGILTAVERFCSG
jgi:cystathionine beta-lyase family protein involved in aluminum resistance